MRTKRIHVVGCSPRSGTTLLAEALGACFEIDACVEHEASIHTPPPPGARTFLTKKPGDLIKIGPVLRVDPDLHVVYMLRDPRDIVTSRHGKAPDRYWTSLKYWKAYTPIGRRLRDHPRFTTVRYEDLVNDPDRVQRALAEAMPFLEQRAPFSRYHDVAGPSAGSLDALRGLRPIAPVSVGKWREHLPRLAGQIQIHGPISDDLVEYGYEDDYTWAVALEGVEPDLAPSHLKEHFSDEDLRRKRRGQYREAVKVLLRRAGIDPRAARGFVTWQRRPSDRERSAPPP